MTSVKLSTTEDLLAVLPHQLGHRPDQCVSIVMLTDKVLGPVARVDIPPEAEVRRTADHLLESLRRIRPDAVLLVGHDTVPGESRSLLRALHTGLLAEGVGILDHVVVRDGRWWGWCCRPADQLDGLLVGHVDGHPVPDEASVPAVAAFIARGSAPLASRDAVGALVEEDPALSRGVADALSGLEKPHPDELDQDEAVTAVTLDDADECDGACPPGCDWCDSWGGEDEEECAAREAALDETVSRIRAGMHELDRVPELWARVLAPVGERGDTFGASDDEVARLARSLADKEWRDSLVAWMSPVMFPLDLVDDASRAHLEQYVHTGPTTTCEQSEVVLRRLLHLATRVPDEFVQEAAAVCTVAACVAWGVGNGATAGDALQRALRVRPGYTLAGYLSRMVEHQLRPRHRWSDVAA